MNQKGLAPIVIILLIAAAIGGYLVYSGKINLNKDEVRCTEEAKICPDGSSVGRTGPKCEFSPCPTPSDETTNWKTYTNNQEGYFLKYPPDWNIEEDVNYVGPSHPNYTFIFKEKVEFMPGISINVASQTTLDQWPPIGGKESLDKFGKIMSITVAGTQGTEVLNIPGALEQKWVLLDKNNKTLIFYVIGNAEIFKVFDQILSTFKFLP